MSRFFKYRTEQEPNIELSEQDGIRSLHLGGTMVQSAMRLSAPNDLELAYTQYMMGFLLFHPKPETILLIGLGGGSLAKFIYHQIPDTKITAIEINPQIITAARNFFYLPKDNHRLKVIVAEGYEYISHHTGADVLMIDGFDNDRQVPSLCSQEFYHTAYSILNKKGILVINLLSRDKHTKDYLQRINNSFNNRVTAMMSEARGNLIVFAFKNSPNRLAWKTLRLRAKSLEKQYPLPFLDFVTKLRKHNGQHTHFCEI